MQHDKICIHTFLTKGFMGWGELFLESLRFIHGTDIHVRIDGRDLSDSDISLLKRTYGNIEIHNKPFDWRRLSMEVGVPIDTIHKWRIEIEQGIVTEKNFLFKIAISVNERYRSLHQITREVRDQGYELLLHSDADIYIRQSLDPLFEIMKKGDFSLYFRNNRPHRLAVVGGFLGFNLTDNLDIFMGNWMNKIDETKFVNRWVGFGQSAIWFAIEDEKTAIIQDLNKCSGAPRLSKLFEIEKELWLGNANTKGPSKTIAIRKCWEDLLTQYPRVPLPERALAEKIATEISYVKNIIKKFIRQKFKFLA